MNLLIFLCIFVGVESFPLKECDDLCQDYLIKYGYATSDRRSDSNNSNNLVQFNTQSPKGQLAPSDRRSDGIINLQKDAGLEETGVMDEQTIKIMNTPRCGVKSSINRIKRFVTFKAFNTTKNKKNEMIIKWFIHLNLGLDMDNSLIQTTFNYAFQIWSNTSLLHFEKTNTEKEANIVIQFVNGDHKDGFPFDGPGNVLGHAFYPGSQLEGQVHLDLDEKWSIYGYNNTISLLHTAIHELGHSLGLGHSSQKKSIMYAWYNPSNLKLDDDDRFAIDDLYGVRPQYRFGPRYNTTIKNTYTTKKYNMNMFKRLIIENSKVSMYLKS
jgi:predicted Zn-dependent protease